MMALLELVIITEKALPEQTFPMYISLLISKEKMKWSMKYIK